MARYSKSWLLERIAFYRRNLVNIGLATVEEVMAVVDAIPKQATKDDLHMAHAKLMSFGRRREWQHRKNGHTAPAVDPESLDAALSALEERAEVVELRRSPEAVRLVIVPASYARIVMVEDLEFWVQRLESIRLYLQHPQCPDPEPAERLVRVDRELEHQRAMLFTQVAAPTAAPATGEEPAPWARDLRPEEAVALLQAWHRVNLEPLRRLPKPAGRTGETLPPHWSILFQSIAWREKRPPSEIVRDRSLLSIAVQGVIESIREAAREREREQTKPAARRGRVA